MKGNKRGLLTLLTECMYFCIEYCTLLKIFGRRRYYSFSRKEVGQEAE